MTPDERYEFKMKIARDWWDAYSARLDKYMAENSTSGVVRMAERMVGRRPANDAWTDDPWQTIFVHVADGLLEKYDIHRGAQSTVDEKVLSYSLAKIFEDREDAVFLKFGCYNPRPLWFHDLVHKIWSELVSEFLKTYSVTRKA